MPRLPLSIWFYTTIAIGRLALLSTAVLLAVTAFAAAVKPLADGKLEAPDALLFMALACVPMLQYVLPFACGFGATLAYHRLAVDNELTASYAGGISHRALLIPAWFSGITVAAVLLVLSNQVIPRFLQSMQEMITADVTRLMVASISKGDSVRVSPTRFLYADSVVRLGPDEEAGAFERLLLTGVVAVQLDSKQRVEADGSARRAYAWLYRRGGPSDAADPESPEASPFTEVRMRLVDFAGQKVGEAFGAQEEGILSFRVPNAFRDDPKFKTWTELDELLRHPERMGSVNDSRRRLAAHLAERATTSRLHAALASSGSVRFLGEHGESVTLKASGITWRNDPDALYWQILPSSPDAPIEVEKRFPNNAVQKQRARTAWLRTSVVPEAVAQADQPVDESAPARRPVTVTLHLEQVRTLGASRSAAPQPPPSAASPPDAQGEIAVWNFGSLVLENDPVPDLARGSPAQLLAQADEKIHAPGGDEYVRQPRDQLRRRIDDLLREVRSKQHERLAMSAACLVMMLTGSVMAMRLRDALPLHVYLWSFFPALATVVTVSAGQQMTHAHGIIGLPLLWGAVVALAAFTLVQMRTLARH